MDGLVLTINRGSSSLKFAVYDSLKEELPQPLAVGKFDRIGKPQCTLVVDDRQRKEHSTRHFDAGAEVPTLLIDWVQTRFGMERIAAVSHRIVHGGPKFSQPTLVDQQVVDALRAMSEFDPDHLPAEIELIETIAARFPNLKQVACFDTGFHATLPPVARLLPIPRRYERMGVRRYGFHGLSFAYLMEELTREVGDAAQGRVVLAHLGAGASLAAVLDGKSIDTSMAFTPTAGLPMATRTGDLDPGLAYYLARTEQMTPREFQNLVNHQSGLLGVSETSGDTRDLLAAEAGDPRAADALDLFCYATKKWICAMAGALGGLDILVFSGGIGEHQPEVCARVCQGLEFLGIELDQRANQASAAIISAEASRVEVRVIATNEEIMLARYATEVLSEMQM